MMSEDDFNALVLELVKRGIPEDIAGDWAARHGDIVGDEETDAAGHWIFRDASGQVITTIAPFGM